MIGNSSYSGVPQLPNPRHDFETVAAALRSVGFRTVTLLNDLTREKLVEALRKFARDAENADWALVYYAGHGIEMNGTNYLIPIDAKLEIDRDVEFEAVPLAQVMSAVEGAKKMRLVLLDACRDNLSPTQMRLSIGTRPSSAAGSGRSSRRPARARLCRQRRRDRARRRGGNSPFVSALVKEIVRRRASKSASLFDSCVTTCSTPAIGGSSPSLTVRCPAARISFSPVNCPGRLSAPFLGLTAAVSAIIGPELRSGHSSCGRTSHSPASERRCGVRAPAAIRPRK